MSAETVARLTGSERVDGASGQPATVRDTVATATEQCRIKIERLYGQYLTDRQMILNEYYRTLDGIHSVETDATAKYNASCESGADSYI